MRSDRMPPQGTGDSPPVWMTVLLLSVGIWLGLHVLQSVTFALTAMTAGDAVLHTSAAWPPR